MNGILWCTENGTECYIGETLTEQWIVEKYNTKVDTKNVNLFIKLYWVQNQTYMIKEAKNLW